MRKAKRKKIGKKNRNLTKRRVRQTANKRKLNFKLELECNGGSIAPAVEMLTKFSEGVIADDAAGWVRLALFEVLQNAYEHGNLGLSAAQKAVLVENGNLEHWLENASKRARRAGKKTVIDASIGSGLFTCVITDSGKGFDWKKVAKFGKNKKSVIAVSGRGLFLIEKAFDKVHYNKRGNQVTLIKKLS